MNITLPDGSGLSYSTHGHGPQHLLLVHGWMTTGAVWQDVLDGLLSPERTVVVMNLRGAAGTPFTPDFTLATQAADIWAVADAAGLRHPILVGHSMGGQLVQLAAARRPADTDAIVLINPVPASGLPLPEEALALFSTSSGDPAKQGAILDMATLALTADGRARLVALAGSVDEVAIRGGLEAWRGGGFEAQLPAITARTLVISTDDPFLPPDLLDERVTSRIERARREHIGGVGHYPLVEAPAATLGLLQDFLNE